MPPSLAPTRPRDRADDSLSALKLRVPPQNLEAEQALLGALLVNNKAHERVADFLAPQHFADPVHARIYEAIMRRVERGQLADAVTLKTELEHDGLLEQVGGTAYLAQLVAATVGVINAGDYGRAIYDAYIRRQLIDIGEEIVNRAFGDTEGLDGAAQIETAEQALFQIATEGTTDRSFVSFDVALSRAIDAAERAFRTQGGVSGLATGFRDLDHKMGGLHASDLVILAGRPGMGKTAFATCLAFNAARVVAEQAARSGEIRPPAVAIFSLEMSAEQLATRLLAEQARVSSDRIRRGDIRAEDFDRFVAASRRIASLPIQIDDTPALTISALRTRCRRLKRTQGLALVVVDYLQLLRPVPGSRPENRVLEISQITQGLKAIAKELHVPVLALSQLSRAVENREDKRPQLADLRESGTIEQDADVVMFLYRDEYYLAAREPKLMSSENQAKFEEAHAKWLADMERVHNVAELILAKQRHGPTGKIELFFEAEFTRFADLDRQHSGYDAD